MIYDCFLFFNEFELLELRLHELNTIVDKFVLVESNKTFSGLSKPLYFTENQKQFSKFADKIIHIVVDGMPSGDNPRSHWLREKYQRNSIARGLVNCHPQDIIIVSDLDEVPNPQTVMQFCSNFIFRDDPFSNFLHKLFNSQFTRFIFHRKTLRHILRKRHPFVWKLEQFPCAFYLNRKMNEKWWYGTRIMHFRDFTVAEEMRYSGYKIIKHGGWHFSFMGGNSRIKTKISATAHQEINNPESIELHLKYATLEKISQDLEKGLIELLPKTELPKFVINHPEKFKSWIIDQKFLPKQP